uniref:Uncharacterized protein n=1 Tax=Arundo donax TaxID=35708 RepID=A0A0A9AUS1_ARUDO
MGHGFAKSSTIKIYGYGYRLSFFNPWEKSSAYIYLC